MPESSTTRLWSRLRHPRELKRNVALCIGQLAVSVSEQSAELEILIIRAFRLHQPHLRPPEFS